MQHTATDMVVSKQLKRLWSLLSDLDADHVARLARAAGKRARHAPSGRRAA